MAGFMCCLHETPRDPEWCEDHCGRYYKCDTVAMADDALRDEELYACEPLHQKPVDPVLKDYTVTITETLCRKVAVKASGKAEAEELVSGDWRSLKHVLDSGDFEGAEFTAAEAAEMEGNNNNDEQIPE